MASKTITAGCSELAATLQALRGRLEKAFAPDTAAPGFVGTTPSTGQCAAASAIVNEAIGGELVSALVAGLSHWFNRLRVGQEQVDVDLTGDQFGFDAIRIAKAGELFPGTRARSFLEIDVETLARARTLATRSGLDDVAATLEGALRDRVGR